MLAAVWLATALSIVAATAAARPNLVFILADDLGYGEVSFNGQTRYRTPNIDRIAHEGIAFRHAYAGSPICAPSRNTLMTGHHTGHATIRNNFAGGTNSGDRVPLAAADVTVAQRLKRAGYGTALIGKWGLGEPDTGAAPWRKGWDFFYGFVNQTHAHNQYPEFIYRNAVPEPVVANFGHKEGVFANDRFTEEALAWLGGAKTAGKPFFLFLSYTTPHSDLRCPPDSIAEVKQAYAWAREPGAKESSVVFAAMMHRLDRDVGRILARLDELGLDRDTVVLFTGDNGAHREDGKDNAFFAASGPFRGIKRDVYEGGLREPFFVRAPGRIAPGRTSDHVLAFWDFPATALDLAGVPRPADLPAESVSFAPTLLGRPEAQKTHDHLYWEILIKNEARQAVRQGKWKLVRYGLTSPPALYDVVADPGETTDLAAREPAVAATLTAILASARTESPHFPLQPAAKPKMK
jgi:arylsulfatase A-like enzyme